MRSNVRLAAMICAMLLPFGLASCGQSAEQQAVEKSQQEQDKQAVLEESGALPLKSGLTGHCAGNDERMPSVSLETTGQYLGITIDGYDKVSAKQFYAYTITFKNHDSGTWYQVNLANYISSDKTKRSITNLDTNIENTYPGWNSSHDPAEFETSIPDTMIHQGKQNLDWNAALNIDGEEVANCPAAGDSTLE